jgi:hypothetical protein
MAKYLILVSALFFISCNTTINKEQLHLLNGYWEIKEVTFTDGTKKEYKINSTVDFIFLDSLKGYRKKVNPKFNGTFETSDDAEPLSIRIASDSTFMVYKTDFNSWEEVLISLSKTNFSVQNEQGITYHYQRYEPINITP